MIIIFTLLSSSFNFVGEGGGEGRGGGMATLLVVRLYEKTFCANKRKAIKKSDK